MAIPKPKKKRNLILILFNMFFILKGLYHLSYVKIRRKGRDRIVVRRVQYDAPKDSPIKSGWYLFKVNNIAINRKVTEMVCEKVQTPPCTASVVKLLILLTKAVYFSTVFFRFKCSVRFR